MTVPGPDYARSVAMAREARGRGAPVGAERPQRRPTRAVLGLALAGIAAISLGGRHAGVGGASFGAAADVPNARTEEVDVMRSVVAIAGAVLASSIALADGKVPPGWMVIADNVAQFSGNQGTDRWWYLFDRGEGTPVEPMPYFGANGLLAGVPGWTTCAGFNCYCIQQAARMHANSPGSCSAPWAGLLRPIRRWDASTSMPIRIEFAGSIPTNTTGLQVDLILDGSIVFTQLGQNGANTQISWSQTTAGQRLDLRLDPVGDNCNADVLDGFTLRILTPDCNGNLIADAIEIANGSVSDTNGDGVPDGCQCSGDVIQNGVVDGADLSALLSVWGTAGGIYPRADANGDGVVNGSDLSIVLSGWGACPQ